ncbi:chromate transporter [Lapidilactobacillus wuchangensis]|uniref:chromate transporter n=1 Tax=Lapidilactobacillus wuchangensis TaxID=2486001 RepID=UPI000F79AA22|nr:chromate transporter [Lapidilactobacillus wuchangensis]
MLAITLAFLKIGFLGFGGGYAMLSLIFSEAAHFGLTVQQFADLNALDGLIPGPIAINSATYVGQLYGGFGTALAATLAVCVPSLIIVPLYTHFEARLNDHWQVPALLKGIKSAAVGLILAIAALLMLTMVGNVTTITDWSNYQADWLSLIIIIFVATADLRWHLNPLLLILLAGLLGGISYYL